MSGLPIDYRIDRLLKEIQNELRIEFKLEIPYEVIKAVVEQQAITTAEGLLGGHSSIWKYFGNFVATKKNVDSLNKRYAKIGLTPMLVDSGLMRMSFTKAGEELGSSKFEAPSNKDYVAPDNNWSEKKNKKVA